jgi:hypothetical protein
MVDAHELHADPVGVAITFQELLRGDREGTGRSVDVLGGKDVVAEA